MTVATEDIAVGHVVQFYGHDQEPARTVGQYLADTIRAGGVAIAIPRDAGRRALEFELTASGIDPAAARGDGSLLMRDAAETLGRLMRGGRFDRRAFRELTRPLMLAADNGRRPIRAYGEMVNVLWDSGDVRGAIELERLWNELQREFDFSLLCAYRSETVGSARRQALEQVCGLHSSVAAEYPAECGSPGAARRLVSGAMRLWGYDGALLHSAELVVSEIATNAVIHGRSPFGIVARSTGSGVRVSVRDENPVRPTVRDHGPLAPSGRGLKLVSELAGDWGVEAGGDGKTVWAELSC
jgi:anti-sigma regulatory factor (Ser/Thr protein kinase)